MSEENLIGPENFENAAFIETVKLVLQVGLEHNYLQIEDNVLSLNGEPVLGEPPAPPSIDDPRDDHISEYVAPAGSIRLQGLKDLRRAILERFEPGRNEAIIDHILGMIPMFAIKSTYVDGVRYDTLAENEELRLFCWRATFGPTLTGSPMNANVPERIAKITGATEEDLSRGVFAYPRDWDENKIVAYWRKAASNYAKDQGRGFSPSLG